MTFQRSSERMAEGLARAQAHWQHSRDEAGEMSSLPSKAQGWTIAISRDAGVLGTEIAQLVGEQLGWPVYDRELLQKIADERGLRVKMLESIDEKHMTWLEDCIQSFSAGTDISENTYVRYLVELLFSLSAMGESIVVGRGGAQILPPETTLRVRLIAPRNHRIATVAQFSDMSQSEATKWVDTTDQNRHNFVLSHFSKNPTDALNYDLIINTCRLSEETVAEVIVQALYQLKAQRSVSAAVS